MKKAAAAIVTGLVITGLSAVPALAAPTIEVKPGVGIGTSQTDGAGVRITVPSAGEIKLIDTSTFVTLDPEGGGTPDREAHARFNAARVTAGSYADVPIPNWSSDLSWRSGKTDDAIGAANETVKLPENTETLWSRDWEEFRRQVREDIDFAESKTGVAIPFDEKLPFQGASQVWMQAGALVDGVASPGALSTHLDGDDASAEATSMVDLLKALSGLGVVIEGGLGGHGSKMGDTEAVANTSELVMKEFRMELQAVLGLFGINVGSDLTDETMAAVFNALKLVDTDDFTQRASAFIQRQIEYFGDPLAYQAALTDLATSLASWAGLLTCDQLDGHLATAGIGGAVLDQLDLECVGALNGVQSLLNDVQGLIADLHEFLVGSLEDASLLTVLDINTSLSASAAVDQTGNPVASVTPDGRVSQVLVGNLRVLGDAGFSINDTLDSLNDAEDTTMNAIDFALSKVHPDLAGRIDVRFVSRVLEDTKVVRTGSGYAYAAGELSLMNIRIRPMSIGLPEIPSGGGGGPLPLARADVEEPIEIALGEMSVEAEHTRPGVPVVCCDDDGDPNTPPNHLPNAPWDPNLGFGGGAGIPLDGGETSRGLPRTGAASGGLPIVIVSGLGALAVAMRRLSLKNPAALASKAPGLKPGR